MNESENDVAKAWYDTKSQLMIDILGEEHDEVMHALIPYAVGGPLDLYYYPSGIPGTGVATKELTEAPGEGPSNSIFDAFELVMFTRETINLDDAHDDSTSFGAIHQAISGVLNRVAPYSLNATLNAKDTSEFPPDIERVGGKCLFFDAYKCRKRHADFGLLLIMEIHRSEMDFARKQGGAKLLAKLKKAKCYPYSDLNRRAVV